MTNKAFNAWYNGPQGPCKDCERRVLRCHATCEEYRAWRVVKDDIKAERYREQRLKDDLIGMRTDKRAGRDRKFDAEGRRKNG